MKMTISKSDYENNLLFYTILKMFLQCKLSNNQFLMLKQSIIENKSLDNTSLISLLSSRVVKDCVKTYDNYVSMLNLCTPENYNMWIDLMLLSIELLMIKSLLLEESKLYVSKKHEEDILAIKDKLSLQYDILNLEKPYGQRVVAALLVYMITYKERENELLLDSSEKTIKQINELIESVEKKYNICTNNMFMVIVDESVNQSIKSTAGNSYEDRVEDAVYKISTNPKEIKKHVLDKNIPSVEYDFVFPFEEKIIGVSAKRTLRERYKQNSEDTDRLSVDAIFVVNLGIDLNFDKLGNVLQKHGYFVVVSQEIYDRYDYLKKNKRVIPSTKFTKEGIERLFKKLV